MFVFYLSGLHLNVHIEQTNIVNFQIYVLIEAEKQYN